MTTVRRKMNRQFKRTSQKKRGSRNHRSNRGGRYRNRTQRGGAADVEVIIDVFNKQWVTKTPQDAKNKLRIIKCIESVVNGQVPPFPVSPAEIKTQLEANPAIKGLLSNQGFKDSIKTLDPASGGDFFKWLGLVSISTEDIPVETLKNAIKKITSLADDATRVIIEDALSLTLSDKTRDTINKIVADTPLPFPAKMAIKAGMASWDVVLKPLVIFAIKQFIKEMKKTLTAQIAAAGPAPSAAAPATSAPATSAPATSAPATSAPAVEPVAPAAAPVTAAAATSAPAAEPVTAAAATSAPATTAPAAEPVAPAAEPATTAAAAPATTAAAAKPIVTGVYPNPPP